MKLICYFHKNDIDERCMFTQPAEYQIPVWAVNVREYHEQE